MRSEQFRDLTFIDINKDQKLVISCDSAGAIGEKEKDVITVSPKIVGYFTAHVALAEIYAIGSSPMTIINTLSVEMNPTGKLILEGIQELIKGLNISEDIIVTGSTEENFSTLQTGMGITAIGIIDKKEWKCPYTPKNTSIVVVGIPKLGSEIRKGDNEIISLNTIKKLKKMEFVHELLPVGSKGILEEVKEMARTNNLNYHINENSTIDLYKSGGPSTCLIISVNKDTYKDLNKYIQEPFNNIGYFY
ncbi:selenophosphate synthase [Clostridium sp. D2Q-11]|uniref:Selenophosphate synthase n=1 Tax=Anaeromonas frigoriresistens TaxID=2683708 RepID=A0A942Z7D5_9FIRM|nr:AIR synthase related protein [Anaeromonas frigoriresistens]MBS4538567.1 selenophosphate synthase [Anaeromonas frigoriresistens]